MEPFAQVEDVQRRLDFDLDAQEETAVSAALEDLSDEARFYGDQDWVLPSTAPNMVKVTVLKAVARWARNMNGYVLSRAGDETIGWPEAEAEVGAASFSQREIKLLKSVGSGRKTAGAFGTISVVAYNRRIDVDTYIGVLDSNRDIPFVDPSGW